MGFRLRAGCASETGPHRANNEDAAFTASSSSAIADGVGGGPAGELASSALLHRLVATGAHPRSADAVRTLVRQSNWDLGWHSRRDPALTGLATTLTALFVDDDRVLLAHVGDSRAYRLQEGSFARMTRDDSYVQALVDAGLIDAVEAAAHPHRNVVTASLRGTAQDIDALTVTEHEIMLGERWLLCSDGVSDYLPDALLSDLLPVGAPEAAARTIVATALSAGSRDNVTALVCELVAPFADPEHTRRRPEFFGAAAQLFAETLDDTA